MPKIDVREGILFKGLGRRLKREELIQLLPFAKAELDDWVEAEKLLKIELNDTNRPDLWSDFGLLRQLKLALGSPAPQYPFMSDARTRQESGERVVEVDSALREIRPYIAAFLAEGPPIDDDLLKCMIQSQEKLCWSFGRKRRTIAMGIYRGQILEFPVRYRAADPDKTSFIPLDFDRPLSLRQILAEHPKGREFGFIVEKLPRFPFLEDARGEVLSFPPIINSARLGAVEVGDRKHFVELTGPDLDILLLAANIVACDFADAGYTIRPVRVEYPYDTPYGRSLTTPYAFQKEISLQSGYASKLLGQKIGVEEAASCIRRMGSSVRAEGDTLTVLPPPYRNDFLHAVDAVEEIMIGRGMDSFAPVWPEEFTIGRLTPMARYVRRVRDILVGIGFQEMIYNYLGSRRDYAEKMNQDGDLLIEIANPMSENYAVIRNSALPSLLATESVSVHAAYPHRIFEIGKAAIKDPQENSGSRTLDVAGFLICDREAGFNDIHSCLSALMYYLAQELRLEEVEDPRFIAGRCGAVMHKDRRLGILGELHPQVLANWGIPAPCAAAEIALNDLLE